MRPEPEFSRACSVIEGAERNIDYHEKWALEVDIDKSRLKKGSRGHTWGWEKVMSLWTGWRIPLVRGKALFPVRKFQMGRDPRYLCLKCIKRLDRIRLWAPTYAFMT